MDLVEALTFIDREVRACKDEAVALRNDLSRLAKQRDDQVQELQDVIREREDRINELSQELTRAVHGEDAIPEQKT